MSLQSLHSHAGATLQIVPPVAPAPPAAGGTATVPVAPILPALTIGRAVGRNSPNRVADVRLVQDRLLALRYLDQAGHAAESPAAGATGSVPAAQLTATIAAIEALQREVQGMATPDGQCGPGGRTLGALNRAIPRPTAAEYAAAAAARAAIVETVTRGVTLTLPVGNATAAAVAAGQANRPADVTAVQQRLVQLGHLAENHGELPPAGATASLPEASLQRTRAAIRRFQDREVTFWRKRGEVTGALTPSVVAPNDATQRLLDRIANYRELFAGGEDITFRDYPASNYTVHPRGTSVTGTALPAALPVAEYTAVGLTPAQTNALRFVSAHEGNFDALNTYDQARVSFGFIHFAGGRGLPPLMALLKARRPAIFAQQFGAFGIEVEFNVANGRIANAALALLDPAAGRVLRGNAAETGIRDSARLSAVFIRAGRNLDIQRVQIEAATRDYILPSLAAQASYDANLVEELAAPGGAVTATYAGAGARAFRATPIYATRRAASRIRERTATSSARIETLLTSEQGLAVLMDRAIQDGAGPGGGGVVRVVGALRWVADREGLAAIAQVAGRERLVLQQVVDDYTADGETGEQLDAAIGAVGALKQAAATATATVAGVLALPQAGVARQAVDRALAVVPRKSFVPGRDQLATGLPAERARLNFAPPPANIAALRALLQASGAALAGLRKPFDPANARAKRARVQDILTGPLAAPVP